MDWEVKVAETEEMVTAVVAAVVEAVDAGCAGVADIAGVADTVGEAETDVGVAGVAGIAGVAGVAEIVPDGVVVGVGIVAKEATEEQSTKSHPSAPQLRPLASPMPVAPYVIISRCTELPLDLQ